MTSFIYPLALFLPLSTLALPARPIITPSLCTLLRREGTKAATTVTTTLTTEHPPSSTSEDESTAKAEVNLFGKVASLAAERASSSATAAAGDATKTNTAQSSTKASTSNVDKVVYGTLTVEIDPYICASNGNDTYCNEASPEKMLPIHSVYYVNGTTTTSWVFSVYEKGDVDAGHWKDSEPEKVVKCEIQVIPGGTSNKGAVQVHTQRPFVKEVDPKNFLSLKCNGDDADVEKEDSGERHSGRKKEEKGD